MVSMSLFYRMISSKKSATFWDHARGNQFSLAKIMLLVRRFLPSTISACAGCLFHRDTFTGEAMPFRAALVIRALHPRLTATDTFRIFAARGVLPIRDCAGAQVQPRFSQNSPAAHEPPDRLRDRHEFPATRRLHRRGSYNRAPYARERRGATTANRRGPARLPSY